MALQFQSYEVPVGTDWADAVKFRASKFHSLLLTPVLDVKIGSGGLGKPLYAGQDFGMSFSDLNPKLIQADDEILIRAYAAVATTMNVIMISEV